MSSSMMGSLGCSGDHGMGSIQASSAVVATSKPPCAVDDWFEGCFLRLPSFISATGSALAYSAFHGSGLEAPTSDFRRFVCILVVVSRKTCCLHFAGGVDGAEREDDIAEREDDIAERVEDLAFVVVIIAMSRRACPTLSWACFSLSSTQAPPIICRKRPPALRTKSATLLMTRDFSSRDPFLYCSRAKDTEMRNLLFPMLLKAALWRPQMTSYRPSSSVLFSLRPEGVVESSCSRADPHATCVADEVLS